MRTNTIPRTTVPIYKVKHLSTHAKALWSAWHTGLSISDEAWEDYLASVRAPYVSLEACKEELKASGWIA